MNTTTIPDVDTADYALTVQRAPAPRNTDEVVRVIAHVGPLAEPETMVLVDVNRAALLAALTDRTVLAYLSNLVDIDDMDDSEDEDGMRPPEVRQAASEFIGALLAAHPAPTAGTR